MPEAVQRFPAAASLSEVGNGGSLAEAVDDGNKSDGVGSVAADTDAGSGIAMTGPLTASATAGGQMTTVFTRE